MEVINPRLSNLSNMTDSSNQEDASNKKYSTTNATQKGFSLIELMIVIVIIGILSFKAVPTYKDYVIRTKVANMLVLAEATKLKVAEHLISGGINRAGITEHLGFARSIEVHEDNHITVTGDSEKLGLMPREPALRLVLTPDLDHIDLVMWRCSVEPADYSKFAPAECRQ